MNRGRCQNATKTQWISGFSLRNSIIQTKTGNKITWMLAVWVARGSSLFLRPHGWSGQNIFKPLAAAVWVARVLFVSASAWMEWPEHIQTSCCCSLSRARPLLFLRPQAKCTSEVQTCLIAASAPKAKIKCLRIFVSCLKSKRPPVKPIGLKPSGSPTSSVRPPGYSGLMEKWGSLVRRGIFFSSNFVHN